MIPTTASRPLRSDALVNRERLLDAALVAVRREGHAVPLATIAADAGVGVGTLYRRYPNREALLGALEARAFELVISTVDEITEAELSGLEAIEVFLDRTIAHRDRLFLPLQGAPVYRDPESERLQLALTRRMARLVRSGWEDGTVRRDVSALTVVVFGSLLAQPLPNLPDWDAVAHDQKRAFIRGIAP